MACHFKSQWGRCSRSQLPALRICRSIAHWCGSHAQCPSILNCSLTASSWLTRQSRAQLIATPAPTAAEPPRVQRRVGESPKSPTALCVLSPFLYFSTVALRPRAGRATSIITPITASTGTKFLETCAPHCVPQCRTGAFLALINTPSSRGRAYAGHRFTTSSDLPSGLGAARGILRPAPKHDLVSRLQRHCRPLLPPRARPVQPVTAPSAGQAAKSTWRPHNSLPSRTLPLMI